MDGFLENKNNKRMRKIILIAIIASFALSNSLFVQEHHQDTENHQSDGHDGFKRHRFVLEFGYTHCVLHNDFIIWCPKFGTDQS